MDKNKGPGCSFYMMPFIIYTVIYWLLTPFFHQSIFEAIMLYIGFTVFGIIAGIVVWYFLLYPIFYNSIFNIKRFLFLQALSKSQYQRDEVCRLKWFFPILKRIFLIKPNIVQYLLLDFIDKKYLTYDRLDADNYIYIITKECPNFNDNEFSEVELFKTLLIAAGDDYQLTPEEYKEFANTAIGGSMIVYINENYEGQCNDYLRKNSYIRRDIEITSFNYNQSILTEKGLEKVKEIYGRLKFIQDFTLLNEKDIGVFSFWEKLYKDAVLFNESTHIKKMIDQDKAETIALTKYYNILFDIKDNKYNLYELRQDYIDLTNKAITLADNRYGRDNKLSFIFTKQIEEAQKGFENQE